MKRKDVIKCHKGSFWSEPLKRISVYEYCISPGDVDVVRHYIWDSSLYSSDFRKRQ